MPDIQLPVIPISETTQFWEIFQIVEDLAVQDPKLFAPGLFLFAVCSKPAWKTEQLKFPPVFDRAMVACVDPQLGELVVTAMRMIEDRDAARLGSAPKLRPTPLQPREKLSLRKIFEWMEHAPATAVTYSLGQRVGENLVGFIRTAATIENFQSE